MKRFFTLFVTAFLGVASMLASVNISGTDYELDTISRRQIGPGLINTIMRLPGYPLTVYLLEMDLNNNYNRVETTYGYNTLGKTEALANAYKRHQAEGKHPLAACNGNFWVVAGNGSPWADYMLGVPFGGVVYNDTVCVNTNTDVDTWDGGPTHTGSIAIDHNKTLYVGTKLWTGSATCSKMTSPISIIQVNKRCNEGEAALYGPPFGRTRAFNTLADNDNVFLKFAEGSSWGVNTAMKFIVQDIKTDAAGLTLGTYDACLTASGTDNKAQIAKLSVGDTVTINQGWRTLDAASVAPQIENMIEGNAQIMDDGVLTSSNDTETYNSMVYSRTCYGTSKDGKHLYMIVIDKSSGAYGLSNGCPTAVACQILQHVCPDVWDISNFDAGGSAEMLVNGSVINTTTEGTPRAVACGWMLYSTAPTDSTIASLAFNDVHLKMPVFTSYSPKVLGYNKYGDLISENVTGYTITCNNDICTGKGDVVTAGAKAGTCLITATLGDATVTAPVQVVESNLALRIKPTLLIDKRDYSLEVTSVIDGNSFKCDPTHLTWNISDPSVAEITDGVLKAKKEGTTSISCAMGDFADTTNVKVEIANAPRLYQPWTDWTLKSTGAKNMTLGADGVLSMTYSGGRGAYISLSKDVKFYSIPDKITLEFTSTIPLQYIQVDMRDAAMTATNYVTLGKETGYAAGTKYTVELPISTFGDPKDLILYPVSVQVLRFVPATTGVTTGANSITLHGLYADYSSYDSGVKSVTTDAEGSIKVYPNPVTDGTFTVCAAGVDKANVSVFNQSGSLVQQSMITVDGGSASVDASALLPGVYFVKVATTTSSKIAKIIVK
jgi:hypothetical protein